MAFAYFFARYFTVRHALAARRASPSWPGWWQIDALDEDRSGRVALGIATIAYGAILGVGLPLRGQLSAATRVALNVELRLEPRPPARQ